MTDNVIPFPVKPITQVSELLAFLRLATIRSERMASELEDTAQKIAILADTAVIIPIRRPDHGR